MDKPPIQFQAQVKKIQTMADGGMGITLHTQDIPHADKATLLDFGETLAWVALAEMQITKLDIPDVVAEMEGEKSESQRMRAILYKIWELNTDHKQPFPQYYRDKMFQLNEKLREQLN